MKNKKRLFWIIPVACLGSIIALPFVVVGLIATPAVRQKALDKGVEMASQMTGYDIELNRLYLSPFHQSLSSTLNDSVVVDINHLFIGHAAQDTLLYLQHLSLCAQLLAMERKPFSVRLRDAIPVYRLALDSAVAHTDSIISAVTIDANIGHLRVTSPGIALSQGLYPLHQLHLADADIAITLNDTPEDTTATDTTATLMVFDVPDGCLENFRFRLNPMGLDIATQSLQTTALADVGHNLYDVPDLHIGASIVRFGSFGMPIDTLYGDARVDLATSLITSHGLHALMKGNSARARGSYNIDKEAYDVKLDLHHIDLSPFIDGVTEARLNGSIQAKGRGIDPQSRRMRSEVHIALPTCVYNDIDASGIKVNALVADTITNCDIAAKRLTVNLSSPKHLSALMKSIDPLLAAVGDTTLIPRITSCQDLTLIDTLLAVVPPLDAQIRMEKNSVAQPFIDKTGLDIDHFDLSLHSDPEHTHMLAHAAIPVIDNPADSTALRLPKTQVELQVDCHPSTTDVVMTATTDIKDGLLSLHGLNTAIDMEMDIHRVEKQLHGSGLICLENLHYGSMNLDDREVDFTIEPSTRYPEGAFALQANLNDIPLDLVDSILQMSDLDLSGHIRAQATIDGLPSAMDMSAQVQPVGVKALYKPYEVELALGETPITMEHNNIQLNGLPIYGTDSTYIALHGGLNLDSMYIDASFASDSFAPVRLVPEGPIPVFGTFAAALNGRITGPLDHFDANAEVEVLPVTDITYPIDKKNFAQISPTGKITAHFADSLSLGGALYVNKGLVKFSPKAYPLLPFQVDSGSCVRFNGPIGATELAISASQTVKTDVQSEGEDSRRVEFNAGVQIKGSLDSIGMNSIGFFLEAPKDDEITQELASKSEEDRDGLAVILLGTGMYVGESNIAAQKDGYALSTIVNSKLNAAMANSKAGKVVDIELSSGEKTHGNNVTSNDLGLTISKSFFKDKMRVSIGTSLSDNPEINKTQGLLNNVKADFRLVPSGNVLAHIFSRYDYDNVLEGELNKSGAGIRAFKDWKHKINDSLQYIYNITGDVDVIYRSNNSIGPDAALTLGARNLMGNNEALSLKLKGAYYWSLQKNFTGDPKNKNTYKLGADLSFVLPYLHWGRADVPNGNTRYFLGYQYENIAGGYDIHQLKASFTYFIRQGEYITHAFTPFSFSGVLMQAGTNDLKDKAADYPQLVAVIAGNELVPSIGYEFTYSNYHQERTVNTTFDLDIKESANLINAIHMLFGNDWNKKNRPYDQFVKTSAELRNRFNITPTICFATRLFAGAILPLGNSEFAPLSEKFHTGGPLGMRAAPSNTYGPGNFYSSKYNQAFFHTGDIKLEANVEFRFPIVWKLRGAVFADAGNIWNWQDTWEATEKIGEQDFVKKFGFTEDVEDGFKFKNLGQQLALGTGFGLRLDIESIVVRLDLGVGLHIPYQTYKYDKEGKPTDPITKYYNIPSVFEGLRLNFGIGYPF